MKQEVTEQGLVELIKDWLAKNPGIKAPSIDPSKTLDEQGISSIDKMDILILLEDTLSKEIAYETIDGNKPFTNILQDIINK